MDCHDGDVCPGGQRRGVRRGEAMQFGLDSGVDSGPPAVGPPAKGQERRVRRADPARARSHYDRFRRGEVSLEANDDLVLNGVRVVINCPREEEVQRQGRAARDLRQLLAVPFQEPGDAQRMPRSEPVDESGEEVE